MECSAHLFRPIRHGGDVCGYLAQAGAILLQSLGYQGFSSCLSLRDWSNWGTHPSGAGTLGRSYSHPRLCTRTGQRWPWSRRREPCLAAWRPEVTWEMGVGSRRRGNCLVRPELEGNRQCAGKEVRLGVRSGSRGWSRGGKTGEAGVQSQWSVYGSRTSPRSGVSLDAGQGESQGSLQHYQLRKHIWRRRR